MTVDFEQARAFFLDGVAAKAGLNQHDGLHPTAAGIDVVVKGILPKVDELLALQDSREALNAFGVEGFVKRLERRRRLTQQVHTLAGTEYLDLLEQLVGLLYEKVRPSSKG